MTIRTVLKLFRFTIPIILFVGIIFTPVIAQTSIERLLNNLDDMEISKAYVDSLNELAYLYYSEDIAKIPKVNALILNKTPAF